MTFAVEAHELVKHFSGKDGEVEAVRGVDLAVAEGSVFGFLGPNGAGKSTTVKMLTTLMTITSGTARVAGVDVKADPYAPAARSASRSRRPVSTRGRRVASCSCSRAACSSFRLAAPPSARRSCWSWSSSKTPPTAASRATPAA